MYHQWAGEARIRDIISGLVADLDCAEVKIGTLSGGQRRRVALAALLVQDWDVIILDEPTNHLDVEGISWLAEHINKRWSKSSGTRLDGSHPRPLVPGRGIHHDLGSPRPLGRASSKAATTAYACCSAWNATASPRLPKTSAEKMMKKELASLRRGAPARTSKPKFRIEAANQLIADVPPARNPLELHEDGHQPPGQGRHRPAGYRGVLRCQAGAGAVYLAYRPGRTHRPALIPTAPANPPCWA